MTQESFQTILSQSDYQKLKSWKIKYNQLEQIYKNQQLKNKKQYQLKIEQCKLFINVLQNIHNILQDRNINKSNEKNKQSHYSILDIDSPKKILENHQIQEMKALWILQYSSFTTLAQRLITKLQSLEYIIQSQRKQMQLLKNVKEQQIGNETKLISETYKSDIKRLKEELKVSKQRQAKQQIQIDQLSILVNKKTVEQEEIKKKMIQMKKKIQQLNKQLKENNNHKNIQENKYSKEISQFQEKIKKLQFDSDLKCQEICSLNDKFKSLNDKIKYLQQIKNQLNNEINRLLLQNNQIRQNFNHFKKQNSKLSQQLNQREIDLKKIKIDLQKKYNEQQKNIKLQLQHIIKQNNLLHDKISSIVQQCQQWKTQNDQKDKIISQLELQCLGSKSKISQSSLKKQIPKDQQKSYLIRLTIDQYVNDLENDLKAMELSPEEIRAIIKEQIKILIDYINKVCSSLA